MSTSHETRVTPPIVELMRQLDVRISEPGQRALAVMVESQNATGADGRPVIDFSGLKKPLVGKCSIVMEDGVSVSFPSRVVREALNNVGKEDAKPARGTGAYRSQQGPAEVSVAFAVGMLPDGSVTTSFSVEPLFKRFSTNAQGEVLGRIPLTTLSFQSATHPRRAGGMEN